MTARAGLKRDDMVKKKLLAHRRCSLDLAYGPFNVLQDGRQKMADASVLMAPRANVVVVWETQQVELAAWLTQARRRWVHQVVITFGGGVAAALSFCVVLI